MTYIDFLQQLSINSDISWNFCDIEKINDKHMDELLNNIAFSFLSKDNKINLYKLIKTNALTEVQAMNVKFLIEEEFSEVFNKYPIRKTLIEQFVNNLFDWIEILCDEINENIVKNILTNIKSNNIYFWYTLSQKLYEHSKDKENLILIKSVKELFINNFLYEDLILLEIKTIKQLDYIHNDLLLKRICELSDEIKSFKYNKIILKLECILLSNTVKFEKVFDKYSVEMEQFDINELLNIYELAVLSQDTNTISKAHRLLLANNIYDYDGLEEFRTCAMLEALDNGEKDIFEHYREDKEKLDNYDFRHIDWYLNKYKGTF